MMVLLVTSVMVFLTIMKPVWGIFAIGIANLYIVGESAEMPSSGFPTNSPTLLPMGRWEKRNEEAIAQEREARKKKRNMKTKRQNVRLKKLPKESKAKDRKAKKW